MGRFSLLASSLLFVGLADPDVLKYGWPALGLLFLVVDLIWVPLLTEGLLIQVFAWTMVGHWEMCGILLVLFLLHRQSMRQQTLQIDLNGLSFSFPWRRRVDWCQLAFIIVKDGLITIEYKNGRVFQQAIEKDLTLNEANFNEFCQQQCPA